MRCARRPNGLGRVALAGALLVAGGAIASELADNAYQAFKAGQYDMAARWYHEVIVKGGPPDEVAEAEFGVADALGRLHLYTAASQRYRRILAHGQRHPYYDKSVERVALLGAAVDDRALVPGELHKAFGANDKAILNLPAAAQPGVHYHLGVHALLQDDLARAERHLKQVPATAQDHAAAQHLLARVMIHPRRKGGFDLDAAHQHIDAAESAVKEDPKRLRRRERIALGLLASWVRAKRSELLERVEDKRQELGPDLGFRRDLRERRDELRAHLLSRAVAEIVTDDRYEALQDLHRLRQITTDPEVQLLYALVLIEMCELDKASSALKKARSLLGPGLTMLTAQLALVRGRPTDGSPLPDDVTEAIRSLNRLPGVATRSGVSTFYQATLNDLEKIDEGALGRGALTARLRPALVAQRDALRDARIEELLAQGDLAAVRLREAVARASTADRLIARERGASRCPSRPPDASARAYGLALILARAQ
jgi:tetratricopeptide (TPR) repeat protein